MLVCLQGWNSSNVSIRWNRVPWVVMVQNPRNNNLGRKVVVQIY